ncbi:MAG: DUF4157 domain-containing protein [Gammaproteobacteria bacterium]|nr:DUF4157 domain-containing protein [Gammaproteobacteria bacterium]NNC96469.1 DUF4157 domain-containing protein [Gammaproteobacteria bacterium]NNM14986.1 DUF4157 domain-containing protein [Gammaproteobacteria bacterium]
MQTHTVKPIVTRLLQVGVLLITLLTVSSVAIEASTIYAAKGPSAAEIKKHSKQTLRSEAEEAVESEAEQKLSDKEEAKKAAFMKLGDIKGEAVDTESRVPGHNPEWVNHNDMDPGIADNSQDAKHKEWIEVESISSPIPKSEKTKKAVVEFQKKKNLKSDGIVGASTIEREMKESGEKGVIDEETLDDSSKPPQNKSETTPGHKYVDSLTLKGNINTQVESEIGNAKQSDSKTGKGLIAHELTHVVQQSTSSQDAKHKEWIDVLSTSANESTDNTKDVSKPATDKPAAETVHMYLTGDTQSTSKESGEKGGTTDMNIGVGELQETSISKIMDKAVLGKRPGRTTYRGTSSDLKLSQPPISYVCEGGGANDECFCDGVLDCHKLWSSADCEKDTNWQDSNDPSKGGCKAAD